MSYLEKNLTADFSKWFRTSPLAESLRFNWVVEFKIKHNKESLNLVKDFQSHQIPTLTQVQDDGIYYKISDFGGSMTGLKPFDAFHAFRTQAFVGVGWQIPRKKKMLYLIEIQEINDLLKKGITKLKEEDAKRLAYMEINLMGV